MKVLTAEQMREVDRLTTGRYGIPGIQLMENAATSVVDELLNTYGPGEGSRILVLCGKGNNGGDGAAVARILNEKGARVKLILLGRIEETRGDAKINFDRARQLASNHGETFATFEVTTADEFDREVSTGTFDLYIDAIFGTGLTRPASGLSQHAIEFLRLRGADARAAGTQGAQVVAVDIPSGIASDGAELIGPAVQADLTVTFTAPKIANVLPPACYHGGRLVVRDIGSPLDLIESSGSGLNLIDREMVSTFLRDSRRQPDANKGDAGKVLIVAGSRGKIGAACLAGEAAMRAGAGLVTVATAESSQPVVASRLLIECMTEPLAETPSGAISVDALHAALELAKARDVVAIGPGIGASEGSTRDFVRDFVSERTRPIVIDADGLNALAPWPEILAGTAELPIVLTPHPGEMARLAGCSIPDVLRDRVEMARRFSVAHSLILLLKGSRTVVAAPDGEVYINPTGNEGMAGGGTGDVLTGVIAGLLAQRASGPLQAAIAAVYLHGLAGDIGASKKGIRVMVASDISAHLGDAFLEVGGDEERLRR